MYAPTDPQYRTQSINRGSTLDCQKILPLGKFTTTAAFFSYFLFLLSIDNSYILSVSSPI
jgi:hypothetical protein